MSEFVDKSLKIVESFFEEGIQGLARGTRIAIYGNQEVSDVAFNLLKKNGLKDIFFIAKNHPYKDHNGCIVVDVEDKEVLSAEIVLTTSLTRSEVQKKILLQHGFTGKIVTLPDLSHLSVELLRDSSTISAIEKLSNCHYNKPAFIIGNGPSLNATDPRFIDKKFVSFAGNGIVNLDGFSPDYYFALDRNVFEMWPEGIRKLVAQRLFPARMKGASDKKGLTRPTDIFFPMSYLQYGDLNVFDWRGRGFESGHTVVSPMLQFALLMGCRPIYLIGVDISYGTSNNYFTPCYHPKGTPNYLAQDTDWINRSVARGIDRAITACRQEGVEVFNCSPTRNIPLLENLNFHEVIKHSFVAAVG